MKIMLDKSPKQLQEFSEAHGYEFWQLRTPLTAYRLSGRPYGLDNGAFSNFDEKQWSRLVDEARQARPVFVCAPDIVGCARRTLEMLPFFQDRLNGLPIALVLQDGIGNFEIPWNTIDAVFVGGSDEFKTSNEAFAACKAAKMLNKWVHVGRVNTAGRVRQWIGLADSIDGSGISRYDHMLRDVLREIRGEKLQETLL